MKSKPVYAYDIDSGEFVKSYEKASDAEREFKAYRGAIYEFITGRRKASVGNLVWLDEKVENYYKHTKKEPREIPAKPESKSMGRPVPSGVKILSEDDLRKRHDMFYIVYNEVKSLGEGEFVEEAVLLRKLQIYGKPGAKMVLDHPDIKKFKGKADSIVYYGNPNKIKQLKEEGVLR